MVERIDAGTLKGWLDEGERLVLVDARAQEDYAADHLPEAVSLLNAEVEDRAGELIPEGVKVVVYSNDAACPASGLVAAKLDLLGYHPVYDYNDSYRDWVNRGYPVVTRPPGEGR